MSEPVRSVLPPVLCIRQPWTWLIIHGGKDIENRTWSTTYRGTLLIHAAKRLDEAALHLIRDRVILADLPRGGVIGAVDLIDCTREHRSRWFEGPCGFVLANPRPLPFLEMPGRLGLFKPPAELTNALTAALGRANFQPRREAAMN